MLAASTLFWYELSSLWKDCGGGGRGRDRKGGRKSNGRWEKEEWGGKEGGRMGRKDGEERKA